MTILDEYLLYLQEGYRPSTIRRGRSQKLQSTSGTLAVNLAKKKNDPMYKRMIFFKQMYKNNKAMVMRKYKTQAMMLARQRASEFGRPRK
jgi:hypothetical protein